MTTRNSAASMRPAQPRHRVIRALLGRVIAAVAGKPRSPVPPQRGQVPDDWDLAQRVRECGEW